MTDLTTSTLEHLTRLSSLAIGLEAEGYFGASKLCRALLHSLLIRASTEQGVPRMGHGLDEALSGEIALLREHGLGTSLLPALERALTAARENRTTSMDEIPAVFVCRACGETYLGDAPARCARCGSDRVTFWDVPPIYHLEPLPPQQIVPALESFPTVLRDAIAGMSEDQMRAEPAPGEWSIRDVAWHLLMAQGVLAARAEILLTEENPSLASKAVWAMDKSESGGITDILTQFEQSRKDTLARLQGIGWDDWMRSAWHTEFGQVTLLQQATYFGVHERYHLPQIAQIRRALGV